LTHALAGTLHHKGDGSDGEMPAALLESQKDLAEHAWVVHHIGRALESLVETVDIPSTPSLRRIRDIFHLETPIRATLRGETGIARLLDVLHPTPAVCGFPSDRAAEWIARHETTPRGWYSGGVGWVDANGDSCINVAIRSCLVGEGEALVYTGAGIVDASNAQSEYVETSVKQGPMMRTLDVEHFTPVTLPLAASKR
jgi:isochorismate synthase EntC